MQRYSPPSFPNGFLPEQQFFAVENMDAKKRQEAIALEDAVISDPNSINLSYDQGNTYMHKAVIDQNEHSIRKLLLYGASMRIQNAAGDTPVRMAFRLVYTEGLEIFSQLCKNIDLVEADRKILSEHRARQYAKPTAKSAKRKMTLQTPKAKRADIKAEKNNYGAVLFFSQVPVVEPASMMLQDGMIITP